MSDFDDVLWPDAAPTVRGSGGQDAAPAARAVPATAERPFWLDDDEAGPPTSAMALPLHDEDDDTGPPTSATALPLHDEDDDTGPPTSAMALPLLTAPAVPAPAGEWRALAAERPLTPALGLPEVSGRAAPPPRRGAGALVAASGAAAVLAVGLVAALVLRDGASTACDPVALRAAPAAAVAAAGPLRAPAPPISTDWTRGKITYYGPASPGGACMASSVPANRYTVALGPQEYAGGAACGTYVDLRGPRGTIRAKVTNLCPECEKGHLDLSDEAFAALDDPGKGVTQIRYRAVVDPTVGALTVQAKDGSNPWWLALRIDNHGNALESVEVRGAGRSWQRLELQEYGYWVLGSGAGEGPFQVRVTDVRGHRATVRGVRLAPGEVQRSDVRLYGAGAAAPAPTTREDTPKRAVRTTTKAATKSPASAAPKTPTPSAASSAPSEPAEDAPVAAGAPTAAATLPVGDGC